MKLGMEFEALTHSVRSKISWGSWTQRVLGGKRQRQRDQGELHYSVYIYDHLDIADYSRHFLLGQINDAQNGPITLTQALQNAIIPLAQNAKFEGDILARWAQHELCAHVNIRQARNTNEEIQYEELVSAAMIPRLTQPLKTPAPAKYNATVPVSAILSAVHNLSTQYRLGNIEPMEAFGKQRGTANKNRGDDVGTYTFSILDDKNPEEALRLENELTWQNGTLIFTRMFPLLTGRPHEIRQRHNMNLDNIPPCAKCQSIWGT